MLQASSCASGPLCYANKISVHGDDREVHFESKLYMHICGSLGWTVLLPCQGKQQKLEKSLNQCSPPACNTNLVQTGLMFLNHWPEIPQASLPHSCVRLLILSTTQVPRTCKYDAALFLLVTVFHRKIHHLKRWEIQVVRNPVPMASVFSDISWKVREMQRKKCTLGGKKRQSVDLYPEKEDGARKYLLLFSDSY